MSRFRLSKYLFSLLLIFAITPNAIAEAQHVLPWQPKDGEQIQFDVLRKGKPFGTHTVSFSVDGDRVEAKSNVELEVKIGPFRAFYYNLESDEVWQNGEMVSLDAKTRKDGDDLYVKAAAKGDKLEVDGSDYKGEIDLGIIPSSHWNINEVKSSEILSTETGEILSIDVTELGSETLSLPEGDVETTHYRLVSELTVDLWYDQSGRWVKCQFDARGQTIEYVLKN